MSGLVHRITLTSQRTAAALLIATLTACGGGADNHAPQALSQSLSLQEDSVASGTARGSDVDGDVLTYAIVSSTAHGRVAIDAGSGAFTYVPDANYFGTDSFAFTVRDGKQTSAPATISLNIENVNDPPVLPAIPELSNSAYTQDTSYMLGAYDVDNDTLGYLVSVDDPSIATASVDDTSGTLTVHPLKRGATRMTVQVHDAQFAAEQQANFSVGDVTKVESLDFNNSEIQAVELANGSSQSVEFTLTHNGFATLLTDADMVAAIAAITPIRDGEPFEGKLWRFLRDHTYHNVPLDPVRKWINEPSTVINSLGWGFCSQVAATFVRIARAAGYEARVHGLTGHVVPEIKIEGHWVVYDPDLAVYYRDRNGGLAGVAELEADPSLITDPVNPVLSPVLTPHPYSQIVADIYGSPADNFIADGIFLPDDPATPHAFVMPPGSRFTYPGHWTETPIGFDGPTRYSVPHFLQAALEIPSGWSGPLLSPWLIWDIQGAGRVRVGSMELDIGAQALTNELHGGAGVSGNVEVLEANDGVRIVFFINALAYVLKPADVIALYGQDVWAVRVTSITLPSGNQIDKVNVDALRKPIPASP